MHAFSAEGGEFISAEGGKQLIGPKAQCVHEWAFGPLRIQAEGLYARILAEGQDVCITALRAVMLVYAEGVYKHWRLRRQYAYQPKADRRLCGEAA